MPAVEQPKNKITSAKEKFKEVKNTHVLISAVQLYMTIRNYCNNEEYSHVSLAQDISLMEFCRYSANTNQI